ncbi:MAG: dihydroneopterin aldolase [Holosporaceae bacterium]|jgi:dihydroneopterin aldolase|nr:dihydroneopterin aldolase [Holosporaceae bacterium]
MIKQLDLLGYEMFVIVGSREEERITKHRILVNISLRFSEKNMACDTDDLSHTVCYEELISLVDAKLQNSSFNLIEKIAKFLYDEISTHLNNSTILKRIRVTKPELPIKNLPSAAFLYSDW